MNTLSSYKKSILLTLVSIISIASAQAQTVSLSNDTSNFLVLLMFGSLMFAVVLVTALMADKIIKLVADKLKVSNKKGIIPSLSEVFPCDSGSETGAKKKIVRLSKGFDIKLNGEAKKELVSYQAATYAVKPTDFHNLKPIPKMLVKEGDKVKAGDKLFFDRGFEGIFFTSPVSGEVAEIKRGEQRAILEIIIKSDGQFTSHKFNAPNLSTASKSDVLNFLAESGALTFFTERPFGMLPQLGHAPKAIHVSSFDTAPYAVDYNFLASQINPSDFQKGLDVLNKLTEKVHLNLKEQAASLFENATGVTKTYFNGPHPAGNVGVQISHIDPIRKGDFVWTIKVEDVANIGKLFIEGVYAPKRYVAVAGSTLSNTFYAETIQGAHLNGLVAPLLKDNNTRVVSGNPLTGRNVGTDGYLGFNDNVVCGIEEGNEYEAFGWMIPSYARPSISPTFPWKMMDFMKFDVNTNTHGEKRAFVVSGQYEEVTPMNIYPQCLLKSIIKSDFEEMEGLGIYEVLEEDLALCEFVCTSKQPVQAILREGLDYVHSQS